MAVIGIDPGPEHSAWACVWPTTAPPFQWTVDIGEVENDGLLAELDFVGGGTTRDIVVCEWIVSTGRPVGASVFDTCRWVGKIERYTEAKKNATFVLVTRPEVVRHFCGGTFWTDESGGRHAIKKSMVRRVLYDRFGGSRRKAVGTKKCPGPLYGIVGDHQFDALACAIWYVDSYFALPSSRK